ncbi:MAG: oxidoreductase [Adhaeribacter sp.]
MSKTVNVGLIGYGMAGQVFHAPIITSVPGLHLTKIRETKPANIQLANQRYPLAEIVADTNAILEDETIQVVVIATPNHTHYALAEAALLARKHVVVDKPFTVTVSEADALIALAARQNCLLTVHHNRRWDSNAKTLRRVIASQLLGRLVELEIHFDRFRNFFRPGAWREENIPGSGIFYDLGPHLIDEAQVLFGLPLAISADERIQRTGGKTIDNFTVVLDYEDLKVTLKGGMLVREPGPTYQLLGEQGSYVKYGTDVQEEALKTGLTPMNTPDWGIEPESRWGKINTEYQGQHLVGTIQSEPGDYRAFYANVYAAVLGQEPLAVNPEQARNTIRIVELARQSSTEKRTIPWSHS